MPLQRTPFGELDVTFDDKVLRPRQWTELQARWAAQLLSHLPAGPVLELCAGAGHIGLLTVLQSPRLLVQVDESQTACDYARLNADSAGLGPMVEIRRGDLAGVLAPEERFALILADPPWVPSADVLRYPEDPLSAIDGGPDGLRVAWACLEVIDQHLMDGGSALLQLGSAGQVRRVEEQLAERTSLGVAEFRVVGDRGALVHLRSARQPAAAVHEHQAGRHGFVDERQESSVEVLAGDAAVA